MSKKDIVKAYYSIKGWFKCFFLKKNGKYVFSTINAAGIYQGKRTFYMSFQKSLLFGATFFKTETKTYPYWILGIYNIRKTSEKEWKQST